jgi:hypothetical protein
MGQLALRKRNSIRRRARRGLLSAGWLDVRLEALEPRFVLSTAVNAMQIITDPIVPVDPPIVVDGGDSGTTDPSNGDNGSADDAGSSDGSDDAIDNSDGVDLINYDYADEDETVVSSIEITGDAGPDIAHRDGSFNETLVDFNGTLAIDQYSATIDWGDGNTSAGEITQDDSGAFHVSASHEYAEMGEYAVEVEVDASDGSMAWDSMAFFAHADPMLITTPVEVYSTSSTEASSQYLATLFDIDPANEGDYTVMVDWGDGTISSGEAQDSGDGIFELYADHAYPNAGTYDVNVTVSKRDGSSTTGSGAAEVEDYSPIYFPVGIYRGGIFEMRADAMAPGAGAAESSGSILDSTVGASGKTPSPVDEQSVVPPADRRAHKQPAAPAPTIQPPSTTKSSSHLSDSILSTFDKDPLFGDQPDSLLA